MLAARSFADLFTFSRLVKGYSNYWQRWYAFINSSVGATAAHSKHWHQIIANPEMVVNYICLATLNRAWQVYFHKTTEREGGYFCHSTQISGTTGRIYKIQMALDRSGKYFKGYPILLTSGTDDVTGPVKVKMFNDLPYLALSQIMAV